MRKMDMRLLFGLLLAVGLFACTSLQRLRLETTPIYTAQTSWLSQQEAQSQAPEDFSPAYISTVTSVEDTHYRFSVTAQDDPSATYTMRVRRRDLAIDGLVLLDGTTLKIYLPLLQFPLYRGKSWSDTLLIQEHPRSPVKEVPARFEVKAIESYDYVAQENLGVEKKAFLILAHLPNQVLTYHYLPPSKKFPGTNPIDLYLQTDWVSPNAPRLKTKVLEYTR